MLRAEQRDSAAVASEPSRADAVLPASPPVQVGRADDHPVGAVGVRREVHLHLGAVDDLGGHVAAAGGQRGERAEGAAEGPASWLSTQVSARVPTRAGRGGPRAAARPQADRRGLGGRVGAGDVDDQFVLGGRHPRLERHAAAGLGEHPGVEVEGALEVGGAGERQARDLHLAGRLAAGQGVGAVELRGEAAAAQAATPASRCRAAATGRPRVRLPSTMSERRTTSACRRGSRRSARRWWRWPRRCPRGRTCGRSRGRRRTRRPAGPRRPPRGGGHGRWRGRVLAVVLTGRAGSADSVTRDASTASASASSSTAGCPGRDPMIRRGS